MPKRKSPDDQTAPPEQKKTKQAKLKLDGSITAKDEVSTTANVVSFKVASKEKEILCERRGKDSKPDLIWTHGAGGGLSNAATKDFADGFAEISPVVSLQGNMNLTGRVRGFQAVIEHEGVHCALGGRSMGARAAVVTAQQSEGAVKALILVSYPMVGAQKGDSREQVLLDLPEGIDVLFISGSKDSMCDMAHLNRVMKNMKPRTWLIEVQGADHGMSLKQKAGNQAMVRRTGALAAEWLTDRDESTRYCALSWNGKVVTTGWQSKPT